MRINKFSMTGFHFPYTVNMLVLLFLSEVVHNGKANQEIESIHKCLEIRENVTNTVYLREFLFTHDFPCINFVVTAIPLSNSLTDLKIEAN